MTVGELSAIIKRHNRIAWFKGFGFLTMAVLFWLASFLIFKHVILNFCILWSLSIEDNVATLIALGCTSLLAVDGTRFGKRVFDLEDYTHSFYYSAMGQTRQEPTLSYSVGQGAVYVIPQLLFCAPRYTVRAWQAFRSFVRVLTGPLADMSVVITELESRNEWIPLSTFAGQGEVLFRLDRLGMLWHRVEQGEPEVRLAQRYRPISRMVACP